MDRRFYAFTLDRLIAWTLDGLAAVVAWRLLIDRDHVGAGVAVILAVVLLVGLGFSVLLGLRGTSPGKAALGLRVVSDATGAPIGVPAALLRQLVLGISTLPTFGLGVATLAWTAVMDPGRQRRGWHDHLTHGIVVDVRPIPELVEETPSGPRHIVNLTAMRLVPAPQAAPVPTPSRPRTRTPQQPQQPPQPPPLPPAAPPAAPPARKLQIGEPLVAPPSTPPTAPPPLPPAAMGPPTAERTVIRTDGKALARWRVSFDSGESFLVEGLALVGRRPEPRPGEPVRHLVPLRSSDMSLSKTHAQFQVAADGVLVVMDRGSTNGSILLRQGVTRELAAGKPTTLVDGDRVRFGDRTMTVAREA
ncbi:RDD family protein [Nocardioides ginsengisegetis]|uniref:RDD family protein n=1 Tax=Nocardioides ginsengisegetis TaxID=661491 RepID=UPI0024842A5D|nr:RDD family protein [Nocardioides ginsengisegetis]